MKNTKKSINASSKHKRVKSGKPISKSAFKSMSIRAKAKNKAKQKLPSKARFLCAKFTPKK